MASPNNSGNTKSLATTLYILLSLLALLNFIGFKVYSNSHSSEEFSTQLWNYFESDLFELITISLLLPIVILVLENHFNVIRSVLANHLKREETIRAERRELAKAERQKRSDKRWETISFTEKMMSQLFDLAIQVEQFKLDGGKSKLSKKSEKGSKAEDEATIEDIHRALSEFSVSANITVNKWQRLKLSHDDEDLFLYLINVVLGCSSSVAKLIQFNNDQQEISRLQAALGIIWRQIKARIHQPVITILKEQVRILDLQENGESGEEIKKAELKISQYRESVNSWVRFVKKTEQTRNDFLPEISGNEVTALRTALSEAQEFLQEHPKKGFSDFEGSAGINELYYKIPREFRFHSFNFGYSKEFIERLADELGLEGLLDTLIQRTK